MRRVNEPADLEEALHQAMREAEGAFGDPTVFIVTMALAFGLIEVLAGLMPTYWTYAATLPVMGLAALLTLTASNASG